MKSGRFFIFLVLLPIWMALPLSDASAFWGFGEEKGGSGLDFEHGYDLNTVTTVKGKVISVESADGSGPVTITMARGEEIIHAVAAPKWFWFDRGISIKPGDELKVVGAKAQGKDGEMYVISREIANITSGEETIIRDKSGRPAWKGGGRAGRGTGGGMQRGFGGGRRGR
jgi:hypothetical protein